MPAVLENQDHFAGALYHRFMLNLPETPEKKCLNAPNIDDTSLVMPSWLQLMARSTYFRSIV
jgi:hypothetical protein